MATRLGHVSRQRLMENITLLWTLNEIVEFPKENGLREDKESWRQLPIKHEKTLADLLAFLSATHDDNKKVTAVCIEESRNHQQLTIRISANTGDSAHVTKGFNDMAKILEHAHRRVNKKEDDYVRLLRCIVDMNQLKIMCRLRSRHAARTRKTQNRRSPLVQLREALDDPSIEASGAIRHHDLCEIRMKARDLEVLFLELESNVEMEASRNDPLRRLFEIVQATESLELTSEQLLVAALKSSRSLDPSTRDYLPIAVGKLARYSLASRTLIIAARKKKYSVFSNIKIEQFQIPLPDQPLFQAPFPSLDQAWQNLMSSKVSKCGYGKKLNMMTFFGNLDQTKAAEFSARLRSASNVWKIHAEIQLLAYHELNPEQSKPRVIASSKDACYLCNLFVSLHGQYHVPRSHGRIYDRWLLPDWLDFPLGARMSLAMEQLNTSIEQTIITTVRAQRVRRNHPNESTLFSIKAFSASTVETLQLPTPVTSPIASVASNPRSVQTGIMQLEADVSTSVHHVSKSEDSHVGAVKEEKAENTHQSPDESPTNTGLQYPNEQLVDIPPTCDSTKLMDATSILPGVQEESPNFSSASLEIKSSSAITARYSSSIIVSSSIGDSNSNPITSNISSPALKLTSEGHFSSATPPPDLASTRDISSLTGLLNPTDRNVYFEIGKLHLTLTRDPSPLSGPEALENSDQLVQVKLLDGNEQHSITTDFGGVEKPEIIDAQAIAPGEEITVAQGAVLSEHDLLLSCGSDTLLSIKYKYPS